MALWSKGLGRLVLTMRLSERETMQPEAGELVMRGTMGEPTYWNWAVNLGEEDVLDFLVLLRQPAVVGYMIRSPQPGRLLRTALAGAALFLGHTLLLFLGLARRADDDTAAPAPPAAANEEDGDSLVEAFQPPEAAEEEKR